MSKKNRRIKRPSPEPQNQLPTPSSEPFSQYLELRQLVEKRLKEEMIDRGELISKLSAEFRSTNNFIEHIILVMLSAKKLGLTKHSSNSWEVLLDERFKHFLADNHQVKTSLLTDENLIKMLLTDNLLIDMVFEYVFDPIKLDRKLIVLRRELALPFTLE